MDAISLLLLFFVFQGGSCKEEDGTYCTAQRGTIIVERGSVTIPCNFTYPKEKYRSEEVRVFWRRGGPDRCGNGEFIYNHTTKWTHRDYKDRISLVGNPEQGTADITIQNLKKYKDKPMFCCRIELYKGSKMEEGWNNRPGTFIQYKDEFSVEQTDVVPAIIGEDITIPCLVHYKGSDTIYEVSWSMGISDLCAENDERTEIWKEENKSENRGRWSVVNFPLDLSLRIKNVTSEDNKQYCCKVKTKLRVNNLVSSIRGTEVILAESEDPLFEVEQPETTSTDLEGSATLSCSYTHPSDTDPLWTAIFWRVGSPRGIYAYHPLSDMVNSSYRGRTELRGAADLHIQGVKVTDDTTYYCFVMLKFCVGNNKTSSTILYGRRTKLEVNGIVPNNPVGPDDPDSLVNNGSTTWIYVLVIFLVAVIILCAVIILLLKKKGFICQKHVGREDVNYLTSDFVLKDQIPSDNEPPRAASIAPPMAQEESGGVLYAHLNVTSLQQKTSNGNKRTDNESQVLYAAIKSAAPPQDIYSTVNK